LDVIRGRHGPGHLRSDRILWHKCQTVNDLDTGSRNWTRANRPRVRTVLGGSTMPPPKRRSRNANCPKWLAYGNPVVRSEGNGTEEAIMDELERDGLRNQAKGKAKKASGKIRDAVADLTDSPEDDLRAKAK